MQSSDELLHENDILITETEYLCHKWPRIFSTYYKRFQVISSFMTYDRDCNKSYMTGATSGVRTAQPLGTPAFTPVFSEVCF